jgi:class 3 adenylate cyclase/tetratricopeptide (TPR) repeat protein
VPTCQSCGHESAEGLRFCGACGAALVAAERPRQVRKTVTILFCDVAGSTALGERLDPEAVRRTMGRYFDEIRAIVTRHGGCVEKFIGDAVMAVFGIPTAHEDDALRAVRTAAEIRARLPALGEELGVRLTFRTGVNTGEVVTGSGETFATGDAVNVAARFEQAASPGEILVGAETLRLVRDAVSVEAVEPLELKGKREPVRAFRLLEVDPVAAGFARHLDAPIVGRVREQARLRDAFEDAVTDRACHLFTLLGPAGVGKSRLVHEFLGEAARGAEIWRSRCLHYGDDITYWPLVEMLLPMGVEPDAVIGGSPAETQLAFRRLLEDRAATQPQILVLDDVHWAEPVFLDLVEHVADWSRESPIFLLCVARPELLEVRPGWGGGKLNATTILLEPLSAGDSAQLLARLTDGSDLSEEARARIVAAAGGNPLFLEEMLAVAAEDTGAPLVIPPTIQALLQARLDRLDGDERDVIGCGAVEGQIFHGSAVRELAEDRARPGLPAHLLSLVRKELIRPDRSSFVEEEAFRFRHLLIRDAAYDSLPKETRADLHERFARWLETHGEIVELDEIVGYHLEQAHRNRMELDAFDPGLVDLAGAAATRLHGAARKALARGDTGAALRLLERATTNLPTGEPRRLAALVEYVDPLIQCGRTEDAELAAAELRESSDPRFRAYGGLLASHVACYTGRFVRGEAQAHIEAARLLFGELGDYLGLAYTELVDATASWNACRAEETRRAAERGSQHARAAGVEHMAAELAGWEVGPLMYGPVHVDDALALAQDALAAAEGRPLLEARLCSVVGRLLALRGDVDRGRELVHGALATAREAGLASEAAAGAHATAWVEVRAGDVEGAERAMRAGIEELERLGNRGHLSTALAVLADLLLVQGRWEEVPPLVEASRSTTSPDDLINLGFHALHDGAVRARSGEVADGEALVRRAVELFETTDFYQERGRAQEVLAETLSLAGKSDEARAAAERAVAIFASKGDQPLVARAGRLVAGLTVSV